MHDWLTMVPERSLANLAAVKTLTTSSSDLEPARGIVQINAATTDQLLDGSTTRES